MNKNMTFARYIPLCALLLFIPMQSLAQDTQTGSTTGTGAVEVAPEEQSSLSLLEIQKLSAKKQWEERIARGQNFRENWLKTKNDIIAIREERAENTLKREEHRAKCRGEIRKASKFTKLSTIEECYRTELSLNLERLRKQRIYAEQLPGISDDVRWLTVTRLDLLTDAIAVIINAIDSEVYETVAELEEAKLSLYENYRKPEWLMMTRVRADKLLTWIAAITARIGDTADSEGISVDMTNNLVNALDCLSETEAALHVVLKSNDNTIASEQLKSAQGQLRECIVLIRTAGTPEEVTIKEIEIVSPEPKQEENINRRLRRHLGNAYSINGSDNKIYKSAPNEEPAEEEIVIPEPEVIKENEDSQVSSECDTSKLSRRLQRQLGNSACRIN